MDAGQCRGNGILVVGIGKALDSVADIGDDLTDVGSRAADDLNIVLDRGNHVRTGNGNGNARADADRILVALLRRGIRGGGEYLIGFGVQRKRCVFVIFRAGQRQLRAVIDQRARLGRRYVDRYRAAHADVRVLGRTGLGNALGDDKISLAAGKRLNLHALSGHRRAAQDRTVGVLHIVHRHGDADAVRLLLAFRETALDGDVALDAPALRQFGNDQNELAVVRLLDLDLILLARVVLKDRNQSVGGELIPVGGFCFDLNSLARLDLGS